jgi:hypothetical protein
MNYFTSYQSVSTIFFDESTSTQADTFSNDGEDADVKNRELENKIKKQKAEAEKNAKLMQKIWGDNFQSDSLH